MRGEIWWAQVNGPQPVVLLSGGGGGEGELRAVFVVEPARAEIEGVCIELSLGPDEGLPDAAVVRVALPRDGAIPCSWLVTLGRDDLVRRAGVLSPDKLQDLSRMMRRAGLE